MSLESDQLGETNEIHTGSPAMDEPVYLTIGIIGKTHGLKGEALLIVLTDFPERIRKGKYVFLGEEHLPYIIESVRNHSKGLLIKFENVDTIEVLEPLRGMNVFVKTKSLPPLPEGEYYHYQLLGMTVLNEDDKIIGVLTEILATGANDVYVVIQEDGKEELIPALKTCLIRVDVEQKQMVVKVPKYYHQE